MIAKLYLAVSALIKRAAILSLYASSVLSVNSALCCLESYPNLKISCTFFEQIHYIIKKTNLSLYF